MSLGDNLKRIRKEKGFTQGDLSEKTGIKVGHISKLENNESDPKLSTLYKLMRELNCSSDELLMNESYSPLSGVVKQAFNRIQSLPAEDKATLVNVINRYCAAEDYKMLSYEIEKENNPNLYDEEMEFLKSLDAHQEENYRNMMKRFVENEKLRS